MRDENFKQEMLSLLADVREHLAFAKELGVGGFETEFAAELTEKLDRPTRTQAKTSPPPLLPQKFSAADVFVPETRKVATTAAKSPTITTPIARRGSLSNLLEQTKLSKISSGATAANESGLKSVAPPVSQPVEASSNQNFENRGEEKKMDGTSLFGDLAPEKETLPESTETFEDIRADIGDCVRCPLYQGRTNIVHTMGNLESRVLFVGEAPGANEDAEGKPFVGRAGQLLTKIIEAIGLKREEVLIGNVNRCRPPQNRTPTIQEARTCRQFLMREIAVARPEIIVVMGNTATQNLLDTKEGITKLRGKFQDYYGVKVMPTFHPAYLLRDPSKKRETWEDMKIVRDELAKTAK